MPMSFLEIDEARKTAAAASASGKREKKRKSATIARLNPEAAEEGDDLRTGRWTTDEMAYCDKLIETFEQGILPVADGVKLNDFLANMLKSKQSRLTKKMKNAKLSAKSFQKTAGYISNQMQARSFSELEDAFFRSISCSMERAEIRFHLQKEWRELFSTFCVQAGQKLEADDWLSSVEEMDRRASRAKDAARMARRKRMMGYAFQQDSANADQGVFIDGGNTMSDSHSDAEEFILGNKKQKTGVFARKPIRIQPPPFLAKILSYVHRHRVPFEHVDAWVPSFVNNSGAQQKCRLCFAGCATADNQIPPDGRGSAPISSEEKLDLHAFGEYSQKFSFDVGCGLPGRVYQTGVSSWEQSVQNAPKSHFERGGGALQWGIRTVLGVPIPSPNVGRIVVLLYSKHDRNQDQDLVGRLVEEMTKLMPAPKWKLVVDIGAVTAPVANRATAARADASPAIQQGPYSRTGHIEFDNLLSTVEEFMPAASGSHMSAYTPGFSSLRLLLLKQSKIQSDLEMLNCLVQSFKSYCKSGRARSEVIVLVVRDFLAMSNKATSQQQIAATSQQQQVRGPPPSQGMYAGAHHAPTPLGAGQPTHAQMSHHAPPAQHQHQTSIAHHHAPPPSVALPQQQVHPPPQIMQPQHHQPHQMQPQLRQQIQAQQPPHQQMQYSSLQPAPGPDSHLNFSNQSSHHAQMPAMEPFVQNTGINVEPTPVSQMTGGIPMMAGGPAPGPGPHYQQIQTGAPNAPPPNGQMTSNGFTNPSIPPLR